MTPTEEIAASATPTGGRILLVDDEEDVRRVAKLMLEASGFSVITASSGRDAIEAFRRAAEDIVCIILDVTMPEMDGMETLEQLRGVRRDVRVILSSGFTVEAIASRFAGHGPAGFLKKPYDQVQLSEKVAEVLSRTTQGS
jgi:CheY-like chemotaxis protein